MLLLLLLLFTSRRVYYHHMIYHIIEETTSSTAAVVVQVVKMEALSKSHCFLCHSPIPLTFWLTMSPQLYSPWQATPW